MRFFRSQKKAGFFRFEKKHDFFRFEKKNTYLGFTGVLSSGAPYTPVIGKSYYASIEQFGSLEQPYAYLANIYGSRNSTRYPMYFRTDISLTRDGKMFNKPLQWKFQIDRTFQRFVEDLLKSSTFC